jgi:molecular chaperone GrpE
MDDNMINEQTTEQNIVEEQNTLVDVIKLQLDEMTNKYLRVSSDFDNYRKRTIKEKEELIKYSSERVIKDLLVVVDDFDIAIKNIENTNDINSIKEGISLISNKFNEFLKSKGVVKIDDIGMDFNVNLHDAVAKIPVENEELKGKIVDVIKNGYMINDKVIRYSKVIIGG